MKHHPGTGSSRVSSRCSQVSVAGAAGSVASRLAASERCPAADQREARSMREIEVLADRTIAGMLVLGCRPNQAPPQQELQPRLQVREIGNRDEQLAAVGQHAMQLCECARLVFVGEMFQDVEAERAIERPVLEGQGGNRTESHALGRVIGVDADDGQARCVLVDEYALSASSVEDTRRWWQRVEVPPDERELRDVGRIVVPGRIELLRGNPRVPRTRRGEPSGDWP